LKEKRQLSREERGRKDEAYLKGLGKLREETTIEQQGVIAIL